MMQLELRGVGVPAGTVVLHESPGLQSLGGIAEIVQDPGTCQLTLGDAFFDVFVQVDLGTLHNSSPSHMQTTINKVPPDDGEILEVSHEIHQSISCLNVCDPPITFRSKNRLNLGPGGMGANDLLRWDLLALRSSLGNFNPATCLSNDGPGLIGNRDLTAIACP